MSWSNRISQHEWKLETIQSDARYRRSDDFFFDEPYDYHFARENLDTLARDSECNPIWDKRSVGKGMIDWMVRHGYNPAAAKARDRSLEEEARDARLSYHPDRGTYAHKLCWLAYRELYGWLILQGLKKPDGPPFRIEDQWIDTSLAKRPSKWQLFITCLTARHDEKMEDWVRDVPNKSILGELRFRQDEQGANWVMVYGLLKQAGRGKSIVKVHYSLATVSDDGLEDGINTFKEERFHYASTGVQLMAAELPWRKIDANGETNAFEPVAAFYNWCTAHETPFDFPATPIVRPGIASYLGWRCIPEGLHFVDRAGMQVTRLFWDTISTFLYIRSDEFKKYCAALRLHGIWHEHTLKQGVKDGSSRHADSIWTTLDIIGKLNGDILGIWHS